MKKTDKMLLIEMIHGAPIEQLLVEGYNEAGTWQGVAKRLGISRQLVDHWKKRLGIRIKRVAVMEEA